MTDLNNKNNKNFDMNKNNHNINDIDNLNKDNTSNSDINKKVSYIIKDDLPPDESYNNINNINNNYNHLDNNLYNKRLKKMMLEKKKKVTFTEDTVFHQNCKKSKVCCIYKIGKDKNKNKYERN